MSDTDEVSNVIPIKLGELDNSTEQKQNPATPMIWLWSYAGSTIFSIHSEIKFADIVQKIRLLSQVTLFKLINLSKSESLKK